MTHVLVVDDSPTFRRLVCPVLRDAGYVVSEATDGMDALAAIRASTEPMVVLLDVVMPHMGGIGVLNAVDDDKKMEQSHAFILVTATPDVVRPRLIVDLLDRMRVPLLTKPFLNAVLLQAVSEAQSRLGN